MGLAKDSRYENPKLGKLQQVLQNQFQELKSSRGIVFTWTRQSAYSLHEWVVANQALRELGIKSDVLTGAGSSSQTKHMTQVSLQKNVEKPLSHSQFYCKSNWNETPPPKKKD